MDIRLLSLLRVPKYVQAIPYPAPGDNYTGYVEGNFSEQIPHGYGACIYGSGDYYRGEWVRGKRTGQGTFTTHKNAVYRGEWEDDRMKGRAILENIANIPPCAIYCGDAEFVSSLPVPHGRGTCTYANGDVYKGGWIQGRRFGQGTFTTSSGSMYKGNYVNDEKHGEGRLVRANGEIYQGSFRNGVYSGRGKCTDVEGNVYVGRFYGGQRNGQGTMKYKSGDKYVGNWKNGKREGRGVSRDNHGEVLYEGLWENDEPAKFLTLVKGAYNVLGRFKDAVVNELGREI